MDVEQFIIPIIVVACFVIGYVVKHTKSLYRFVDDIPLIVSLAGAILNPLVAGFSVQAIIIGAVSGLASTGLHGFLKNTLGLEKI